MSQLKPVAFGLAIGVLCAIYVFFMGVFAMFGWGVPLVEMVASFYIGFGASIVGAIVGAIWAFIDGFVAGFIIAWVYNQVAK
ncbi:MAG TPA: bacteriophage holin [Hyphomicrobiales bacterium]|nr:bacteriophage holin [Hyphomicrobiales bacterium]